MKTIILCGGLGTRLREETEYRPKPMVEIGGRPILWHIMKLYAHYGLTEFVLCLGYKGDLIKEYFLNYEAMNNDFSMQLGNASKISVHSSHDEQHFHVTLADTGDDALTGTRIKRVEQYIDDDQFLVTYGDGLSDVNLEKLLQFHASHGKLATVTTVQPQSRFGVLDIDAEQRVNGFIEKPKMDSWINAGFFVFNKEVFNYINNDPTCALEQEPLRTLAHDGQLMAYRHDGFFYAMDTYREYLHLNELWDSGVSPWAVWKTKEMVETLKRASVDIA